MASLKVKCELRVEEVHPHIRLPPSRHLPDHSFPLNLDVDTLRHVGHSMHDPELGSEVRSLRGSAVCQVNLASNGAIEMSSPHLGDIFIKVPKNCAYDNY